MDKQAHTIFPDRGVPLCTRCLAPHDPLTHYCPRCGEAVGQFTPNIPYVNIGFQANFFGNAWRLIWAPGTTTTMRVLCTLTVILFAPILFVALPVVLWRATHASPPGFEVQQSPQQAAAPPKLDEPPDRPAYHDRPIIPH